MVYCHCDNCGFSFPKGHSKKPRCWNCGSSRLSFGQVNKKDISKIEQMLNKSIMDKIKRGEFTIPENPDLGN